MDDSPDYIKSAEEKGFEVNGESSAIQSWRWLPSWQVLKLWWRMPLATVQPWCIPRGVFAAFCKIPSYVERNGAQTGWGLTSAGDYDKLIISINAEKRNSRLKVISESRRRVRGGYESVSWTRLGAACWREDRMYFWKYICSCVGRAGIPRYGSWKSIPNVSCPHPGIRAYTVWNRVVPRSIEYMPASLWKHIEAQAF